MNVSRVLVTGGGGFIGGRLADRLLSMGKKVWVLDNFSTGSRARVPAGAEVLERDLRDAGVTKGLPEVDVVCHLAAQSSGEVSSEDPAADLEANVLGTVRLLDWASRRPGRFLYASSMAVYGQPEAERVDENTPPRPLSFYGIGKWAAEQYVGRYHRPDFTTTSFRLFSVYGPGQNLNNMKQGMVSIYLAYALRGEPVLVKGSLDRFRDLLYVDDAVDAWVRALERPAASRVYNVGTGCKTTVGALVRAVVAALGKPADHPVTVTGPTPADQFGLVADAGRLSSELGWVPRVGLEEGLAHMAAWAKGASR